MCIRDSLSPSCTQGSNADAQTFTVQNDGGGMLNYSIGVNQTWLAVTPASGTSTGEADTITVSYTTAALTAGTHNATITVTDPTATNNPQTIAVILSVQSLQIPGDFDGDNDVDQTDFGRFQACLTGDGLPQDLPDCQPARLDADPDVDDNDTTLFLTHLTGPT